MKSPKDMEAIEIDITNVCPNTCSNCTRFCGHHKKTFFMDFETFKKAVDSLKEYDGVVGLIGGEPTIHPEFEKFVEYLREKRTGKKVALSRKPIEDMQTHILTNLYNWPVKMFLCSTMGAGYYKHFEVINDSFERQLLNDHNNACEHQAILMSRKELGINDVEWEQLRNNCWLQNTWSATITPKGAFFCEVAGALDMLFNGPGGWVVENDWWKKEPKDFADQLHWCELCSMCLDVPKRLSNDGHDDVTPLIYEKLKEVKSPKLEKGLCVVFDPAEYDKSKYKTFTGGTDYMDVGGNVRTTKENKTLYPKKFDITTPKGLVAFVKEKQPADWIVVSNNPKEAQKAVEYFSERIINPGCLYKFGNCLVFNVLAMSVRSYVKEPDNLSVNKIKSVYPKDKIVKVSKYRWTDKFVVIKKTIKRNLTKVSGIKFSKQRKEC